MYPHEFEFLWRLHVDGPQTASELAEMFNRPIHRRYQTDGPTIANQLRRLVAAGLVAGDGTTPQIYRLTDAGREYVDA